MAIMPEEQIYRWKSQGYSKAGKYQSMKYKFLDSFLEEWM
jgi:hypothetical protein